MFGKLTSVIARAPSLGAAYITIQREFIFPTPRDPTDVDVHIDHVPIVYAGVTHQSYQSDDIEHFERRFKSFRYLWAVLRPIVLPTILEMFIGTVFGSIHCAAWTFHFPSRLEQILWRTMSLCITVIPMAIMIVQVMCLVFLLVSSTVGFRYELTLNLIVLSLRPLNYFLSPVYVVARMITLAMAVVLLRELPDGAFQEVQWTLYIPHV
ncbi:hypothetical protein D9757_008628 [Collybiopsis confluens]|uniref:Uncharacterized protein n=1 Tax=Collybiopsis confluens TaxID=2823264 RepID=A0A8H5H3Z6_9AGAR|nr:hypothetical protein D9757_008628 [Collybiopsis confluens]